MDVSFIQKYIPHYIETGKLTLTLSFYGISLSLIIGLLCSLTYIEISRNTPLLIQLFFLYYGLPKMGILLSTKACAMIKTTSLAVLIGVIEVLKVGQQIIEASILKSPSASFYVYGFIFLLYFIICYPISLLSKKLEKRWEN